MNIDKVAKILKLRSAWLLYSYKTTWGIWIEPEIKDKFKFEEVVEYIKK